MYVVFEGIDCVGKSTQIELLKEVFKEAIFTKEPGATKIGQNLREILLEKDLHFSKRTETLLFLADRAEHYEQVLKPNFDKLIISDRSFFSGIAYANKAFDIQTLLKLNAFALNDFFPQKAIFLKADEDLIKERFSKKGLDKIEKRGINYFLNVQNALDECLNYFNAEFGLKILRLDARLDIQNLHLKIKDFIDD